ncbi:MAG TPA: ATP-binding protein [Polyangiaceae bacterium]|nr:ATP-binding protein [Polyangiaceae bacterium]
MNQTASAHPPESHTASDRWTSALESLLSLAQVASVDAGVESLCQQLLTHLAQLVPRCALGLCVIDPDTGVRLTQIALPEGSHSPQQDPARLFPTFAHELVIALSPTLTGATFHMASNESSLEPGGFENELGQRAASLCARLIRHAQKLELSPSSLQVVSNLKRRLVQAEKLASLGQVVTGVVHELATPLTAIISYSNYLQQKAQRAGGDPADIERLTRISGSAERILEFARDLVSYAKPTLGVPATVDLHQVIHKALIFCDHEMSTRQVKVDLALAAEHPYVLGTPSALMQIFINLAVNAAQAMQATGGVLSISSEDNSGSKELIVRMTDSGGGIPSSLLPQIFDPFFTTKSTHHGTGLGLAIVREILQAHRARIEVNSTPGDGSTFTLIFPTASLAP